MTLTVGSLFAGIGGFDLGLERAGLRVRWQVEIDPDATNGKEVSRQSGKRSTAHSNGRM